MRNFRAKWQLPVWAVRARTVPLLMMSFMSTVSFVLLPAVSFIWRPPPHSRTQAAHAFHFTPSVGFGTQPKWIRLINVEILGWFLPPELPLIVLVRVHSGNWAFLFGSHVLISSHASILWWCPFGDAAFMICNCCPGILMIIWTRTLIFSCLYTENVCKSMCIILLMLDVISIIKLCQRAA